MDGGVSIRPRMISEPFSLHGGVRVLVPTIDYDQELDCFYTVTDGATISYIDKTLPANFHTHELLDVDEDDVDSLLAFQQAWGLLTSPRRYPLRPFSVGTLGQVFATPTVNGDTADMDDANKLLDELDVRHKGVRSAYIGLYARTSTIPIYPFAPRAEVAATLEYLQGTVTEFTKYATKGYDPAWDWAELEQIQLRGKLDAIDGAISPYFPRLVLAPIEADEEAHKKKGLKRTVQRPRLPLTIATLVQLMDYLTSDEEYRVCKQCRKLFMYKRSGKDEEGVRSRRSSIYCSDGCKQIASFTAQNRKRKAERQEKKAERENTDRG